MTPTTTVARTPLDVAQGVPTGPLLARLLTLAGEARAGAPQTVQISAAASALQQRCGRPVRTHRLDPTHLTHELIIDVSSAGGFLSVSSNLVRRHLAATMREDMRTAERDPEGGHTVRTHMQVLDGYGIAVFPGPALPAGAAFTVLYERDLLLGQLLAAVTAGEDVDALVEEITAAAG
ncbi:hypothetical protein ACIQK6_13660 [Streptomyces sp. NPDC091682]|uniref:hypothetical protein n=1 Tax=Streptomyces sp. NPDC091682 TaxID=3366005 RepID=UPI003829B972